MKRWWQESAAEASATAVGQALLCSCPPIPEGIHIPAAGRIPSHILLPKANSDFFLSIYLQAGCAGLMLRITTGSWILNLSHMVTLPFPTSHFSLLLNASLW